MNSAFKDGIGGCANQSASPGFPGRAGLASIFPITLVLCLKKLPSEALYQHHRFRLYSNSINFLMS